jgi:hypothetical protein
MLPAESSTTGLMLGSIPITGTVLTQTGYFASPDIKGSVDLQGVLAAASNSLLALTTHHAVSGSVASALLSGSELWRSFAVHGNCAGHSTVTAGALVDRPLVAAAAGTSLATADGRTARSIGVHLNVTSQTVGQIGIQRSSAASIGVNSACSGRLSAHLSLTGESPALFAAVVDCRVDRDIATIATAVADLTATPALICRLATVITALSTDSVSLSSDQRLSGWIFVPAALTANLGRIQELAGQIVVSSGYLVSPDFLSGIDGSTDSAAVLSGDLLLDRPLTSISVDNRRLRVTWHDEQTIKTSGKAMTAFKSVLKPIVRGDTRRIERTFTGLPTGYTISAAWLTIKSRFRDTDNAALIRKSITAINGQDGQITDSTTADGSITLRFDLSSAETLLAKAGIEYLYDIQVRTTSGEIHTLAVGTLNFHDGVTIAA